MKSFILASALFLILIAYTIANAIYINVECDKLIGFSESLFASTDEDFHTSLKSFEAEWKSFRRIARISKPSSSLNNIDLIIAELYTANSVGAYEAREILLSRLAAELYELTRLEKLSFY